MAYQMGVVTPSNIVDTSLDLNWTAASGGTGPYHYQVHRSTVNGFMPGAGNLIATTAAGVLTFHDSGLFPNTQYFYVVTAVDEGNADALDNSAQVGALTQPFQQQMNRFELGPMIGVLDQAYNYNTKSAIIDPTFVGQTFAGAAVKRTQPTTQQATPTVVPAAPSDKVWGFIIFSYKDPFFAAGSTLSLAQDGDVLWLLCTVSGDVTSQPYGELDPATVGGVLPGTPSDGNAVVVEFIDPPVAGKLIRCQVKVPAKGLVF